MAGENGSSAAHGAAPPEPEQEQKATGFRKIVWLRQMLHRWQSTAARRSGAGAATGDDKKPLLAPTRAESSSDPRRPRMVEAKHHEPAAEDLVSEPTSPEADFPVDVPRGCCAVYVGAERRRFVVPTAYLGMQVFRRLLEKAEEEFEFEYEDGALTIPCETEAFKYILVVMDRHNKGLVDDEGNAIGGGRRRLIGGTRD